MNLHDQQEFITAIHPFDRLDRTEQERLIRALDIQYYPEGSTILKAGAAPETLHIIIKGLVREESAEGTIGILGTAEVFDSEALLSGHSQHTFVVVDDTLCYTLDRLHFLALAQGNRLFQDYFFQDFSQKIKELRDDSACEQISPLTMGYVKDMDLRPAIVVDEASSIHSAALLMRQHQVEALLVRFASKEIGVITSNTIRDAVAGSLLDPHAPVATIAHKGVISADQDEFFFNALLLMTKHQVTRLLIEHNGEALGFLEMVDLLSYWSNHAHLVMNRIDRATTLEELLETSRQILPTVQNLFLKGVKVRYIGHLVAEMDRRLLNKAFTLLAPSELAGEVVFIVMGSGGRGEQLLKTDQDNALLLRDGFSHPELNRFRAEMGATLTQMGFPPCPGGVMATEEAWCGSVATFKGHIRKWIADSSSEALMKLAIFYDATAVAGDKTLLDQLQNDMFSILPDDMGFHCRFARSTVAFETPLGFFSQFVLEKSGKSENLDIKKGGLFPIVHGVRSLALEQRIPEVNTARRIQALANAGILDPSFADDLVEAFDFMSGIRFQVMLQQNQERPNEQNRIDPTVLSPWKRELLKDSLRTVNRFKRFIVQRFNLDMVS